MASTSADAPRHDSLLDQFCSVTGADRDMGLKLLQICEWNLAMAVNMQMDTCASPSETPRDSLSTSPVLDRNLSPDSDKEPRAALVDHDYTTDFSFQGRNHGTASVLGGFRDFRAETRWPEETDGESLDSNASKKIKLLDDLFRPPIDLIHGGSFESARDAGQVAKKWLLVNIQDPEEFSCQVLNRDVWSSEAVKSIVSENFIFWQVDSDSDEGQRYIQFYKPMIIPYIAVIDPQTGENLAVWNKVDCGTFCDAIILFLSNHTITDASLPLPQTNLAQNLIDLSEEQQIKIALEASLKDAGVDDDDIELETFDSDSEAAQRDDSNSATQRDDPNSATQRDDPNSATQRDDPNSATQRDYPNFAIQRGGSNSEVTQSDGPNAVAQREGSNSEVTQREGSNSEVTQSDGPNAVAQREGSNSEVTQREGSNSEVTQGDGTNSVIQRCVPVTQTDDPVTQTNDPITQKGGPGSQRDDSDPVTPRNSIITHTKNATIHQHDGTDKLENWETYLGLEGDEMANLVIRLPDGTRQTLTWPISTKMKALILYSESLGFHQEKYELVTHFPRQNLSELPLDKTLKELGLYPREMVFIQLKD